MTAVAGIGLVAVLGAGAYVGFGGGGSSGEGGGSVAVADDGPHKLVAPKSVLSGYEQVDGITSAGLDGAGEFGVRGAKKVQAVYGSGTEANPLGAGLVQYTGAYGKIDDPEKTVDAMFADLAAKARKGPGKGGERSTMLGEPEDFGSDGAVLKCQEARVEGTSAPDPSGRKEARTALCAWADGSTAAIVLSMDAREAKAGRGASLDEAADNTKRLRQEVRVKR